MTITIDTLTNNEITGAGVFDEIMRSVKAHLDVEHTSGRITDVNYSSVYLGAMQNSLDQAVKFTLSLERTNLENLILNLQKENLAKESLILDSKVEIAKIDLYNAKYQECTLQTQIKKVEAETQSVLQSTANDKTQSNLLTKQIAKTDAEIKLYNQKSKTEEAQIWDHVDNVSVAGVIGLQKQMYRNQANGYLRLSEQQNARMMLDAFAVLQSNAGLDNFAGTTIADWGVTPATVKAAVDILNSGVDKQELEHTTQSPTTEGQPAAIAYTELTPEPAVLPTNVCNVTVPIV